MYLNAEKVTVDSDEGRFVLLIDSSEEDTITVNIHGIDLDTFYDQVKGRIGPYLREKEEAFAEFRAAAKSGAFACNPDESGGYDTSDPKSPAFHSIHADIWDMREKNPDEYEYLREESKREKGGEA